MALNVGTLAQVPTFSASETSEPEARSRDLSSLGL